MVPIKYSVTQDSKWPFNIQKHAKANDFYSEIILETPTKSNPFGLRQGLPVYFRLGENFSPP